MQVDTLEQVAFEVLHLIRSLKNRLAPINRIPPEVLTLIPDFWDTRDRDQDVIALSHVCRAWREAFTSYSSLWTDLDCVDAEKTRVYLKRSGSSPINLWIDVEDGPLPHGPLLQLLPHVVGRLKSLSIKVTPDDLQDITTHLSRPAPLLEHLLIDGGCEYETGRNPVLTTTLFDGDLSSLRFLHLQSVRTKLLWRNMANLTSFTLAHLLPADVSLRQLLDFFESAPRLRDIILFRTTPTSGAQNGRLVSLACLKNMEIIGDEPSSLLLDHLVIPVGAELTTQIPFQLPLVGTHLPRSLDSLKNLSNFTEISIRLTEYTSRIGFTGPNGKVSIIPMARWPGNIAQIVLESLTRFDTSKTERLEILCIDPPPRHTACRALRPLKNLRSLTISRPTSHDAFISALNPGLSPSDVLVCSKLEELVLTFRPDDDCDFDIETVIAMTAARASRGKKLKSVVIVNRDKLVQVEERELRKHVSCVVYGGQRRK